jgi:hypothetical protein
MAVIFRANLITLAAIHANGLHGNMVKLNYRPPFEFLLKEKKK